MGDSLCTECERPAVSKGLCHRHYQRYKRGTLIPAEKASPETVEFWRNTYQNLGDREMARLLTGQWEF